MGVKWNDIKWYDRKLHKSLTNNCDSSVLWETNIQNLCHWSAAFAPEKRMGEKNINPLLGYQRKEETPDVIGCLLASVSEAIKMFVEIVKICRQRFFFSPHYTLNWIRFVAKTQTLNGWWDRLLSVASEATWMFTEWVLHVLRWYNFQFIFIRERKKMFWDPPVRICSDSITQHLFVYADVSITPEKYVKNKHSIFSIMKLMLNVC